MELDLYSVIQTLSVRAVVAPVFQRKCTHCAYPIDDFLSQHVCSQCGKPQPMGSSEDYFSALGVPRRFEQSLPELEKRFYALSRALHPDKYSTASTEIKGLSLQRMSWVNQAYTTLKSPIRLREYLLELENCKAQKGSVPPVSLELAESWFEIQDLLMESPSEAQKKLTDFEGELSRLKVENEKNILKLESTYDLQSSRQVLEKLSVEIHTQSYLKSMEKDVERIKKNANSD